MFEFTPTLCTDFYKECHYNQYNPNMTKLVSYYTPRMSRVSDDKLVMFGLQYFIKSFLIENFNKNFFGLNKEDAVKKYYRLMKYTMGERFADTKRWEDLWDLGYLPLKISAIPEGTRIPIKCPMIEITNTDPNFVWLVNYIETAMSCNLWHSMASANVGYKYRQIVNKFYDETVEDCIPKSSAIGDFSMRGQESEESAAKSSAAFLLSFTKTATIPAIEFLEKYYNCNIENEMVATGLASTEHSVMCSNAFIDGNEDDMVKRLLTEIYPNDNFTMVSDSYDYWNMVANIISKPEIKNLIMNHNGFIGIRGDCYDNKTEILTNNGWKLFSNLEENDLVAEYDNGVIRFVKPLRIVNKEYKGKMYNFKSKKYGLDLCVTPNHNMVYKNKKGIFKKEASSMKYYEGRNLIVAGEKEGKIDNLTDYDRLMIAFQADGRCRGINKTEQFERGYTLEFKFSKDRKIKELEKILNNLGLNYKKVQTNSDLLSNKNSKWKDEIIIYVNIDRRPFKSLSEWVDLSDKSSEWCKQFIESVSNWDAHIRPDLEGYIEIDNSDKSSVDIIYTASVLAGYKSKYSIKEDTRSDKFKTMYRCFIDKKADFIGGDSIIKEKVEYDGTIHCVTVPSGMILVRRNGQCAVSGNSGNPVDIICGTSDNISRNPELDSPESMGTVEILWNIFGGTVNSKGYKVLDSHVKAVYRDSITPERAELIYKKLKNKGFAANNVMLGMGSYSLQSAENNTPLTRDTYSVAVKSTYCELGDRKIMIFKDPKTDSGHFKKSQRGCCVVYKTPEGNIEYKDELTWEEKESFVGNIITPVFVNGKLVRDYSLKEIRNTLYDGDF